MANTTAKTKREVGPQEQRFNTIMNSRLQADLSRAGQVVNCQVQSAKHNYPDERTGFLKDIYSFDVVKMNVVRSQWYKEQKAEAIAAEVSGEPELAEKLFNKLLNATQLNTSIIVRTDAHGNPLARRMFQAKEPVKVYLGETQTVDEETGEVRDSLIVKSIIAVESTNLSKGGYDFSADVEEIEEEIEEEKTPEPAKEPAKKVGKVATK